MKTLIAISLLFVLTSYGPEHSPHIDSYSEEGIASYYSDYYEGRLTANGEIFKQQKLTAAHKTLPFGTQVNVFNQRNGKNVQVTINDRGPFVEGRIIDLSYLAAEKLDMIEEGIVDVKIQEVFP